MLSQFVKDLIAAAAESISIEYSRQVSIIGLYIRGDLVKHDAVGAVKSFVITFNNCFALCYLFIDMTEIAYSHSGTEFVHLCVCAYGLNDLGTVYTEVFKIVYLVTESLILKAYCTAFNGVEYLCGMETEA